jgi:hypothetical protein
MEAQEIMGFRNPKRLKTRGKSEFNMANYYFEILSKLMDKIANSRAIAESSMRPRDIINYYAYVHSYYGTLSACMNDSEVHEIKAGFKHIRKNISFLGKRISNPQVVLDNLNEIQEELYLITQGKGILMPWNYEKSRFKAMEKKFGLDKK